MGHIPDETHARSICRIIRVWREGKKEDFNFLMKDEAWHVFKSEHGWTMFPNIDKNALCMDFVTVDNVHSFDHLIENHKSAYEIHLHND